MKINKKGFTLLELLVVVLIIGILAGIALPQYKLAVLKSRTVQAMTFADKVWEAQQIYYLNNGTYAEQFSGLDITLPDAETSTKKYSWGSCYIARGVTIYCVIKINNKDKIMFARGFFDPRRYCRAYTDNEENTVQEKVCINLGGKLNIPGAVTGKSTSLGYIQYVIL